MGQAHPTLPSALFQPIGKFIQREYAEMVSGSWSGISAYIIDNYAANDSSLTPADIKAARDFATSLGPAIVRAIYDKEDLQIAVDLALAAKLVKKGVSLLATILIKVAQLLAKSGVKAPSGKSGAGEFDESDYEGGFDTAELKAWLNNNMGLFTNEMQKLFPLIQQGVMTMVKSAAFVAKLFGEQSAQAIIQLNEIVKDNDTLIKTVTNMVNGAIDAALPFPLKLASGFIGFFIYMHVVAAQTILDLAAKGALKLTNPTAPSGTTGAYDDDNVEYAIGAYQKYAQAKFGAYSGAYHDGAADEATINNILHPANNLAESEVIRNYDKSINSRVKRQLISDIRGIVAGLGLKAEEGKTPAETAANIIALLPSEKTQFKAESHEKICRGIAERLNAAYGSQVVNTKLPAEVICQEVAEILASMTVSMHEEFLYVHEEIRKVIKNLLHIRQILDEAYAVMKKNLGEGEYSTEFNNMEIVHKTITAEMERQLLLLQNLVGATVEPAEETLGKELGGKKKLSDIIRNMANVPAKAQEFSSVILSTLRNMGSTALVAAQIEESLQKVGMTMSEYANMSIGDFTEKIAKLGLDKIKSDKLGSYLTAVEFLYKNFSNRKNIAGEMKTGRGEFSDDLESNLDKRIKGRQKLKNLLFSTFYRQLGVLLENLHNTLDMMARKIGTEIPISSDLDGLRQVITQLNMSMFTNSNVYEALIGYYNDALAKSKRENALGQLRAINNYIDSLLQMDMYKKSAGIFGDVKNSINAVIQLIDKYADEIAAKFGSNEERKEGGADDPQEECTYLPDREGGDDIDLTKPGRLFGKPVEFSRITRKLSDTATKFNYFYQIAQIKSNLDNTAGELGAFGEKYDELLGKSVADKLSEIDEYYKKLREGHEEFVKGYKEAGKNAADEAAANLAKLTYLGVEAGYANANLRKDAVDNFDKDIESFKEYIAEQHNARKKFWNTLQAIDIYMKEFTAGLAGHPADIRDIKSMLDEIQTIAQWYNENAGNRIQATFEHFPSMVKGEPLKVAPNNGDLANANTENSLIMPSPAYKLEDTTKHYYHRINAVLNGKIAVADVGAQTALTAEQSGGVSAETSMPGNPYIVTDPRHGVDAAKMLGKGLETITVLKNLLNTFLHIGSSFGGSEIIKKTFMSPKELYDNLIGYLQWCSFGTNLINNMDLENVGFRNKTLGDMRKLLGVGFNKLILEQAEVPRPGADIAAVANAHPQLARPGAAIGANTFILNDIARKPTTAQTLQWLYAYNTVTTAGTLNQLIVHPGALAAILTPKVGRAAPAANINNYYGTDPNNVDDYRLRDELINCINRALDAASKLAYDIPPIQSGHTQLRVLFKQEFTRIVKEEAVRQVTDLAARARGLNGVANTANAIQPNAIVWRNGGAPGANPGSFERVDELTDYIHNINAVRSGANVVYYEEAPPMVMTDAAISGLANLLNLSLKTEIPTTQNEHNNVLATTEFDPLNPNYAQRGVLANRHIYLEYETNKIVVTDTRGIAGAGMTGQAVTYSDIGDARYAGGKIRPILLGVMNQGFNARTSVKRYTEYRARYGIYMRGVMSDNANALRKPLQGEPNQQLEDEMFTLAIKSIAAKIFTVVGMYDMLERPHDNPRGMSAVRMITGGEDSIAKVDDKLTELYLRLPLLAQFYKSLFGFETEEGWEQYGEIRRKDHNLKISMVPDIDGVFAGIINAVFRKLRHVKSHMYSEADTALLIDEINKVADKLKSQFPNDTNRKILHAFIAEVNRRYGIVTKTERDKYLDLMLTNYDYLGTTQDRYNQDVEVNAAILPDELDVYASRPAPSDRYLTGKLGEKYNKQSKYNITQEHKRLLYKFRCMIDKMFEGSGKKTESFNESIKATERKLQKENNPVERFKLVSSLMRGSQVYSRADNLKYIMFQETVLVPLNLLSGIHTMLSTFQRRVLELDLEEIFSVMYDVLSNGAMTFADFITNIRNSYRNKYPYLHGANNTESEFFNDMVYIRTLFGMHQNGTINGGNNDVLLFSIIQKDNVPSNDVARRVNPLALNAGNFPISTDLMSVLTGVSAADLTGGKWKKLPEGNAKQRVDMFNKFIIDHEYVMHALLEAIYMFVNDSQDLVSVSVDRSKIILNYSKLIKHIEDTFAVIQRNIDNMRGMIDEKLINQVTDKSRVGSYFWLYEQIMEKIIVGRDNVRRTDTTPATRHNYVTLQQLEQKINSTFHLLTKKAPDGTGLAAGGVYVKNNNQTAFSYDRVFAEWIYYDNYKGYESGITQALGRGLHQVIATYDTSKPVTELLFTQIGKDRFMDMQYAARFADFYGFGENYTNQRSLLIGFNQLIAQLLDAIYDPASTKVVFECIKSFCSGTFNASIMNKQNTFPDEVNSEYLVHGQPLVNTLGAKLKYEDFTKLTFRGDGNGGPIFDNNYGPHEVTQLVEANPLGDPKADAILYSTLAYMLRNILLNKNHVNNTPLHQFESLADVPQYVKERLRAYLPLFKSHFEALIKRAEFTKMIMSIPTLRIERLYINGNTAADWDETVTNSRGHLKAGRLERYDNKPTQYKEYLNSICDKIIQGCTVLVGDISNAYRALGDDPKYFETYQNSIKDYESQHHYKPFGPLSFSLHSLQNQETDDTLMGIHGVGSDIFKFLYGNRLLLSQPGEKVTIDHLPTVQAFNELYNSSMDARMQMATQNLMITNDNIIKSLRWLHQLRNIKSLYALPDNRYEIIPNARINHNSALYRQQLVISATGPPPRPANGFTNQYRVSLVDNDPEHKITYSLRLPTNVTSSKLLRLVENADRDAAIREVVQYLAAAQDKDLNFELQNIIDLNIVPINVHAMMREIPFANLYNYGYTFDRLIIDLYYEFGSENANKLIAELCDPTNPNKLQGITSSRDMLIALLLNPYEDVFGSPVANNRTRNVFDKYVKPMLMGDSSVELGRPKFLSDQIYNKVIFGQLYVSADDYKEAGPHKNTIKGIISTIVDTIAAVWNEYNDAGVAAGHWTSLSTIHLPTNAGSWFATNGLRVTNANIVEYYNQYNRVAAVDDNARRDCGILSMVYFSICNVVINRMIADIRAMRDSVDARENSLIGIVRMAVNRILALFGHYHNISFARIAVNYGIGDTVANRITTRMTINDAAQQNTLSMLNEAFAVVTIGNGAGDAIDLDPLSSTIAIKTTDEAGALASGIEALLGINRPANVNNVVYTAARRTVDAAINFGNLAASAAAVATRDAVAPIARKLTNMMNYIKSNFQDEDVITTTLSYIDAQGTADADNNARGGRFADEMRVIDAKQVQTVDVQPIAKYLRALGRLRFDTVLIRNLTFIINLARSVRLKLNKELMYNKDLVAKSIPITDPSIMEFINNQVYKKK